MVRSSQVLCKRAEESTFGGDPQLINLISEEGIHQVSDAFISNTERFAPLFVGDHVVAL